MARIRRKPSLPAPVRAELDLRRGERVLAAGRLRSGGWLVATTLALHVTERAPGSAQGGDMGARRGVATGAATGVAAPVRRPWDQVAGVVWSDTASMLQVTWVDGSRQLTVELATDEGYLPEVLRERVEASVVLSRRFDVQGRRGVRVAIRRAHHGAELTTQVVADHGVDLSAPEVAARVRAELADLREQAGMGQ